MTDQILRLLASLGLLLFILSAGFSLFGRWGHWPIAIISTVITISIVAVMISDGVSLHPFSLGMLGACALALAGFIWYSLQPGLPSLIVAISGTSLQGLFVLAVFLFAWFFRMDRLW